MLLVLLQVEDDLVKDRRVGKLLDHDLGGRVPGDPLCRERRPLEGPDHLGGRIVVGGSHGEDPHAVETGQVDKASLHHLLVGDHQHLPGGVDDPDGPPGQVPDLSDPAVDLHPVSQAEGVFEVEDHSGQKVAQDVLNRQAENHRGDGGGGQERGDVEAEEILEEKEAEEEDQGPGEKVPEEAGDPDTPLDQGGDRRILEDPQDQEKEEEIEEKDHPLDDASRKGNL